MPLLKSASLWDALESSSWQSAVYRSQGITQVLKISTTPWTMSNSPICSALSVYWMVLHRVPRAQLHCPHREEKCGLNCLWMLFCPGICACCFLCAQGNVLLPRNASVSELFIMLRLYHSLGTTDWVNRYISRKQHWYFNHHYINSELQ